MSFVSLNFLIFLAATALVYFLIPGRARWAVLLLASYVFYVLADPRFVPFLLTTTVSVYLGGVHLDRMLARQKAEMEEKKTLLTREERRVLKKKHAGQRRRIVALVLILNFGILAAVKYTGYFTALIHLFRPEYDGAARLSFLLPLGISFYTFQAAGYLLDVYRGKEPAERNPLKLALFLSFFPQIVQGPISRHSQLAAQLTEPHDFSFRRLELGGSLILWGFFKKLMIADRAAAVTAVIFAENSGYAGIYPLLGALCYSVQVYTDFSGGIDIARGAAQILGIDLVENFRRPYFANSITEFWRRWHITLGAWFRDYVFYPLSLSAPLGRLGRWIRTHVSVYVGKLIPALLSQFAVFFLIGIWHGSSLKYVAFGLYHGILIVLGILLGPKLKALAERLHINVECFGFRVFQILRTLILVVLGRLLTMGGRLRASAAIMRSVFPLNNLGELFHGGALKLGLGGPEWLALLLSAGALFAVSLIQERGVSLRESLLCRKLWIRWAVWLGLFFAILIFGSYGFGYDAADFIYRGF